jgi:hypothetical protein
MKCFDYQIYIFWGKNAIFTMLEAYIICNNPVHVHESISSMFPFTGALC